MRFIKGKILLVSLLIVTSPIISSAETIQWSQDGFTSQYKQEKPKEKPKEEKEEITMEEVRTKAMDCADLLQDVLKDQYEDTKDEIKSTLEENGYDVDKSMNTLDTKESVFSNADFLSYIAAYITLPEIVDTNIYKIKFFSVDYKEQTEDEIVPEKTYEYINNGDGTFARGAVRYITAPGKYTKYKAKGNVYVKDGTETITPKTKAVKYADVTVSLVKPEDILKNYGNGTDEEKESFDKTNGILHDSGLSEEGVRQSIMLKTPQNANIPEEVKSVSVTDPNRLAIITTAESLLGKVPYEWGGKPTKPGIDETWWSFKENGEQKGLDCSGFVSWVYLTAGFSDWQKISSTDAIDDYCEDVTDLEPGDIGLYHHKNGSVNHTGIYLGNGYWIHCSSNKGTVEISKARFTVYKRIPGFDAQTFTAFTDKSETTVASDDEYLLAQLVCHEARNQGFNGWLAVAEVVMNRVNSPLFPKTIREVIYSKGQFAGAEEIETMQPSDNIIQAVDLVLKGQAGILNNPDVLFFRNPYEKGMTDWGKLKAYQKIGDHVFYVEPDSETGKQLIVGS